MKPRRIMTALTAAAMTVSAIPLQEASGKFAAGQIDTVNLSGASLHLVCGETPVYSLRLTGGCEEQTEIADEIWRDAVDNTPVFTRSGGEKVPPGDRSAYCYSAVLDAKDGYSFADDFSLVWDGVQIDPDAYAFETDGRTLWLHCSFLPLTEPEDPEVCFGDLNGDGELSVSDAVLLARMLSEDSAAPPDTYAYESADYDRDGILTVMDVTALLRALTGRISKENTQYYDEFGEVELPAPVAEYSPLSEGNSRPFTDRPLNGLTISAEENALSYDGQLEVQALTEEKTQEFTEQFQDYGLIMAAGWEIRAGLSSDAHLPGYYHSAYDLNTIDLPEELYDYVKVMRVDDNGTIYQYPTEISGSVISWDSDQNSFVIIGIIAVGAGIAAQFSGMTIGAIYTVQIAALLVAGAVTYWEASKGKAPVYDAEMYVNRMRFYETSHFTIWYALGQTADAGHKARLTAKENAARSRASEIVLEQLDTADSVSYHINVDKLTRQFLAEDAEYQEMLKEVERVPADVRMLAHQLETAYDYLDAQNAGSLVNQFNLNYKPDVIFTPSAETLGLSVTPKSGADPLLFFLRDRGLVDDPLLIPESKDIMDYYGTEINAKRADDLLITATHEIFHIHQNKYYSGTDIRHLRFSEFSAMVLQNHCAKDYKLTHDITTEYTETVDQYYETYAVPFDEVLDEKEGQSNGYTLSHFYLYLERQTGQHHTAFEFVNAYTGHQYRIADALADLFGFSGDPEKLAKYWRGFLASYADIIGDAAYGLHYYDEAGQNGYPARQRRIHLSSGNQSVSVEVQANDFTATETLIYGPDGTRTSGTWRALIVRDESLKDNLRDFGFILPRNLQKRFAAARTRNGVAFYPKNDIYPVIERQGYGNTGSGVYTVYLLMEPDEPELRYDQDADALVIALKLPDTATVRDRATDCLHLCVYADGELCAVRNVKHEDAAGEIRIPASQLGIPLDREVTVSAAVCEAVTGDAESITYYGPESVKAYLTVERIAETTAVTAVTTAADTATTSVQTESTTFSTSAESSSTTETTAVSVSTGSGTTVTTALRVEPRDIQFSYMSGDFATWDESDDVFIGGSESVWRDGKDQSFYMFDKAPHFRLFADGTFELTVSGHSGRETTYYEDPFTGERELDDDYEWSYDGFTVKGRLLKDNTGMARWSGIITHCTAPIITGSYSEYNYSTRSYEKNTFSGSPLAITAETDPDIAEDILYDYDAYDLAALEPVYGELRFEEIDQVDSNYRAGLSMSLCTTAGEVYVRCSMLDPSKDEDKVLFLDDEIGRADVTMEFDLSEKYMDIDAVPAGSGQFCLYEDAYVISVRAGSATLVTGETVKWDAFHAGGRCEAARGGVSWTGPVQYIYQEEIPLLLQWETADENGEMILREQQITPRFVRPVSGTVTYSAQIGADTKTVSFTLDILTDQGYITVRGTYSAELPDSGG